VPRRVGIAAVLLLFGAALGWRAWFPSELADAEDAPRGVSLGPGVLYSTKLPDLQGHLQSLARWQGKIVVLNFWATWCEPCREEIPAFMRIQRTFAADGVVFIGIAVDTPDRVGAFVRSVGLDYPILLAENDGMELAGRAGDSAQALPFTAVVDRTGQVVRTRLGPYPAAALERSLRTLLAGR